MSLLSVDGPSYTTDAGESDLKHFKRLDFNSKVKEDNLNRDEIATYGSLSAVKQEFGSDFDRRNLLKTSQTYRDGENEVTNFSK